MDTGKGRGLITEVLMKGAQKYQSERFGIS